MGKHVSWISDDRRAPSGKFGWARTRWVMFAALGFFLLVVLVAGRASAEEVQAEPLLDGHPGPTLHQLEELRQDPAGLEPVSELTDPAAAEELPHHGLNREQASELLGAVFGPTLSETASIYDELEVEHYNSNYVALIAPGNQPLATGGGGDEPKPTLLESSLPLRVEDESGKLAPVDLSLEHSNGELQAANPIIDIGLPTSLDEGIALPEVGVRIDVAGGAQTERDASVIEGSAAFYPNVTSDTDLTVAPTPVGVETLTQLRSVDSPRQQTFELSLPKGATLKESETGGAEVVNGSEALVVIHPPSAMDANGKPVPVELTVEGDSLTVKAAPSSEAAYPILVDPVYEVQNWGGYGGPEPNFAGWTAYSNQPAFYLMKQSNGFWGLTINSWSGPVPVLSQGRWEYHVPRWGQDLNAEGKPVNPTSYIAGASLGYVNFEDEKAQNGALYADPFMNLYLWDTEHGFVTTSQHYGNEGNLRDPNLQFPLPNPNGYTDAKQLTVELVTRASSTQYRHLFVGNATVELTDNDYPALTEVYDPSGWVNNTEAVTIPYRASDTGLGVQQVVATAYASNGQPLHQSSNVGCTGGNSAPCPQTVSSQSLPLRYDAWRLPQGEDFLELSASDPLGHVSAYATGSYKPTKTKLKVDHTPPRISVSGSVTEQSTLGNRSSNYVVKYNASDGTHAAAAPLSPISVAGTSSDKLDNPNGVAADQKGHVWVVDQVKNRVVEYDESGQFLRQFGSTGTGNGQLREPSGITVTPEGNVWVVDTGNYRVQEFSPTGTYMQQFGKSGPAGQTEFYSPSGIASAPGGMLWVSDYAGNRIGEFRENPGSSGRFVRDAYGVSVSHPNGLSIDSSGTLWAVDDGCYCIRHFNETGAYLSSFGGPGTEAGQFRSPTNVLATPSGHLLVADSENNRIQELQPNGDMIKQLGSLGTGNGNFSFPRGIALGKGNALFVADNVNDRLARWSNAEYDPQSGAASVQIKVDGVAQKSVSPGCSTRDCEIAGEWTLESSKFSDGAHTVEVIATDGVGLTSVSKTPIVLEPDRTAPSLAVSGSLTEQATVGTTRPQYKLNVRASDGLLGELSASEGGPTTAYAFNEGSGTGAKDSAGHHEATIEHGSWVEGKFGKAISFNGENTCVSVPNSVDLQLSGSFTLEAWVNPANATQWAPVFFKEAESFYSYSLFFGAFKAGHVQGYVADEPWEWSEVESPGTLPANAWSHIALTSDGTNFRLYVNGALVDTESARSAMESKGPLLIGCSKTFGQYFKGLIDNVRIYGRALSGSEVEADKAAGVTLSAQSGMAKTEVFLDGKSVASNPAGCSTENCVLSQEWTLNSASYFGKHTVLVKATDGFGNTTSKSLEVEIGHDTTPPQITANASLYTAPEGWVEQQTYPYNASATDQKGYGVTSLVLKIDGETVKSVSQSCAEGSCELPITGSIDMAAYQGGAHPAELIATDGAGNKATKHWTINVDPEGHITAEEAAETLEAVEQTTEAQVVAPATEVLDPEEIALGYDPGVEAIGEHYESTGTSNASEIAMNAEEGFAIESPDGTLEAVPDVSAEATEAAAQSGIAVTVGNTTPNVDSVIRPIYNGIQTFQSIRDASGTESFSWEVKLHEGQILRLMSPQWAQVEYAEEERLSFTISAMQAHDAIGTPVPTELHVEGNVLTLTVHHRGGGFVYPIVAGAGWAGGFVTTEVPIAPQETPQEEEGMQEPGGELFFSLTGGPPRPAPTNQPGEEASASFFGYRMIQPFKAQKGYQIPLTSVILWEIEMKGFFYYDFHEAWYSDNREPVCSNGSVTPYTVEEVDCEWVGGNHQVYGNGYHITARDRTYVAHEVPIRTFVGYHPMVVRAFGDGKYFVHYTDAICNPSRPGCD